MKKNIKWIILIFAIVIILLIAFLTNRIFTNKAIQDENQIESSTIFTEQETAENLNDTTISADTETLIQNNANDTECIGETIEEETTNTETQELVDEYNVPIDAIREFLDDAVSNSKNVFESWNNVSYEYYNVAMAIEYAYKTGKAAKIGEYNEEIQNIPEGNASFEELGAIYLDRTSVENVYKYLFDEDINIKQLGEDNNTQGLDGHEISVYYDYLGISSYGNVFYFEDNDYGITYEIDYENIINSDDEYKVSVKYLGDFYIQTGDNEGYEATEKTFIYTLAFNESGNIYIKSIEFM